MLEQSGLRVIQKIVNFDTFPLVIVSISDNFAETEEAAISID